MVFALQFSAWSLDDKNIIQKNVLITAGTLSFAKIERESQKTEKFAVKKSTWMTLALCSSFWRKVWSSSEAKKQLFYSFWVEVLMTFTTLQKSIYINLNPFYKFFFSRKNPFNQI